MKEKLPNIIFIVLDTLAAKHMSLYGYHRRTTPNLERIAEECTVYSRCFAPACWTIPSHASMFTGLYPSQHGAYEGNFLLSKNVHHLVPALKMAGYRTLGISSNGLVSPASGLCPGFDYFKDYGAGEFNNLLKDFERGKASAEQDALTTSLINSHGMKEKTKVLKDYLLATWDLRGLLKKVITRVKTRIIKRINILYRSGPISGSSRFTEDTVRLFSSIINKQHSENGQPFFLFINIIEPHELYKPPLKWRIFSKWQDKQLFQMIEFYSRNNNYYNKSLIKKYSNLYDDEIYYTDYLIEQVWQYFKQSPIFEKTMFILTSDHGEHFGEKGLFEHNLSLYNELIWVPLLISFPKGINRAGIDSRLVSLNDLYSTILDISNNPLPRPETSISLLSTSRRKNVVAQIVHPEIYWGGIINAKQRVCASQNIDYSPPIMAAIVDPGLKIIEKRNGDLEVYDLREGMEEQENLVSPLSTEGLNNYREMMKILKEETGFLDVRNE